MLFFTAAESTGTFTVFGACVFLLLFAASAASANLALLPFAARGACFNSSRFLLTMLLDVLCASAK